MATSNALKQDMINLAKELNYTNNQIITLNKFATFKTEWESNVIIPFSDAYKVAYMEYQKILKKDIAAKQRQLEFAFMALSLFGGSAFTAILGKATMGQIMENMAVNYICDRNMTKTFNFLAIAKESPVAGYLTAQTLSASKSWISSNTKSAVVAAGSGKTYSDITDPALMRSQLKQFFNKSELAVRYALNDLLENKKGAILKVRQKALNRISQSPFCQAPKTSIFNPKELAEKIELGFYMKMLLESDHTYELTGIHGIYSREKNHNPISVSPNSAKYPKSTSSEFGTKVRHTEIGDAATKRMNTLYNKIMGAKKGIIYDSYGRQYANRDVLKEAESVLVKLGNETFGKISSRVKPVKPLFV